MRLAVFGILAPFGPTPPGWIFTEMGRQPFVVAPNPDASGIDQVFMFTAAAVSPGVSARRADDLLVVLTAVYAVLLVVEVKLLVKYIRGGVASAMPELVHVPADENEDATPGTVVRASPGRRPGLRLPSFAPTRNAEDTQHGTASHHLVHRHRGAVDGYLFLEGFDSASECS